MNIRIGSAAGLAILAGIVPGGPASAATGDTSSAAGRAAGKVISPIVLTHTAGATLSFGTFTTGTGGKVDVSTSGIGTVTRTVVFVPGLSVTSADQFTLTGGKRQTFSVVTTGGAVTNGLNTMTFTTTPSSTSGSTSTTGTFSFTVGGKLTVAGGESGGQYTGTYTATVAYN
jgi:hypothetical protein